MTNKETTKASYESTAEQFAQNVADLAPRQSIEKFSQLLLKQAKIIDIGCGSGRDAALFNALGIDVVGIDFCVNLIDLAKIKAPLSTFHLMDIEEITFPEGSFDGAWAGCSLIHIPKKKFPGVLNQVHFILKNHGYFYLSLKKGSGESLEKDLRYGDFEKFWSFYEEDELKQVLESARFKTLELCTVEKQFEYQTHSSLRVFCQKDVHHKNNQS